MNDLSRHLTPCTKSNAAMHNEVPSPYKVDLIPDAERCGRSAKLRITIIKRKDLHEWYLAHEAKQKLGTEAGE